MKLQPPRSRTQRKADTLAMLQQREVDVWVASASPSDHGADPYLVPLSLAWVDGQVILALDGSSRTARSIRASGRTRLGLGPTRDVILIDAVLERALGVSDVPEELARAYVDQAGWDPRKEGPDQVFLVLLPRRIQAWREANELRGRTLMSEGVWLD